ncbi:MAG TPA: hypothetical protein VM122_09245 [Usitatibacter sp.]|nr:hypothetical protein [Usitatibacter sp.]
MDSASLIRFAAMAAAAAALYGASRFYLALPCWSLAFVAALFAWPLWRAQSEYALFARRAVLAGVTTETSRVRRWLWAGKVTRVLHGLAALAWATLLLAFAVLLGPWHWMVLAVDVVVVALAFGPIQRRLAADVRPEHQGLVARRWPLTFMNLVILTIAFFVLDFYVVGAPDTRGLPWLTVFDQAWDEVQAGAACPASGALVGVIAAAQRLAWHAAEVLIPALGRPALKLAAWAFFLLQAGLVAYGFTRLLLGAAALAERRDERSEARFAPAFWVTMLLAVALWLALLFGLQGFDPARLHEGARAALAHVNPCRPDARSLDTLSTELTAELQAARATAHGEAEQQVDSRVNAIFSEAGLGVDRYLDWYFTVLGEYQRLGALAASELDGMMARELEKHLFGDGMLGERLERASVAIAQESQLRMSEAAVRLGTKVRESVRANPCGLGALDLVPVGAMKRDVVRASTAAGGGALVGLVAVRSLGRGVAVATASRTASKSTFRAAGGLIGRTVTKRAGTIALSAASAAALCAPGGPLALLCGIGAAVVSWLVFDQALIRIDEALFRDSMRAEIVASLQEQQAALVAALKQQHHASIDMMAASADTALQRTFIPARDGLSKR